MGTVGGIVTGVLALSMLDLALGAGSQQVIGLAAAPANWLQKFVDPNTPLIPDYRIPVGQVGKAGQLLGQILPNLVPGMAAPPAGGAAATIPAPNSTPPPTGPATLNA